MYHYSFFSFEYFDPYDHYARQTRLQTENPGRGRLDLNIYQLENGHAEQDPFKGRIRKWSAPFEAKKGFVQVQTEYNRVNNL